MSVGIGVVGLGFMGRTHLGAYQRAEGCSLVAVCDRDESNLDPTKSAGGNLDNSSEQALWDESAVLATTDFDAMLARTDIQAISICTHTTTHVDLAKRALDAGKHVLVEKPVALTEHDVMPLVEHANRTPELICMPAMCMRFWPGWAELKSMIESGEHGAVRSATFQRLGSRPGWSSDFYADFARSGGALTDLHVHDVDFALHCFGEPAEVFATGDLLHVTAAYGYQDGPVQVVAEGGWDHDPAFGFRMLFRVNFERATVEFDLDQEQPLAIHADGQTQRPALDSISGWDGEIRAFVRAAADNAASPVPIEDAARVARVLDQERAILDAASRR